MYGLCIDSDGANFDYLIADNYLPWKEWLPNCKEYKLGGNYNIEMYAPLCKENPQESYCELWLPIEKI